MFFDRQTLVYSINNDVKDTTTMYLILFILLLAAKSKGQTPDLYIDDDYDVTDTPQAAIEVELEELETTTAFETTAAYTTTTTKQSTSKPNTTLPVLSTEKIKTTTIEIPETGKQKMLCNFLNIF